KGDRIIALNGHEIDSHNTFLYELGRLADRMTAAKTAQDSLGVRTVTLVYEVQQPDSTGSRERTAQAVLSPDLKLGFMPILPAKLYKPVTVSYGFLESLPAGVSYGWNVLSGYVRDMKYVFTADGAKSVGGFGAIGSLFPPVWDWYLFWKMTAFLSIILAFMNILPIPALDGGHVLFLCYEAITRRKPSEQFMIRAEYVGFGILLLLMVVANLNDILRWLGYM
ncbi:MAG: site-2 protease family protein, partial [Prevotella sp.]|nr:site-2 protease family protein [Prevotella sp.]